jgi:predicted ATP-dependent protease
LGQADFDYEIPRNDENILSYRLRLLRLRRDGVRHFDHWRPACGVGSRAVDDQEKLSARFGRLRDVVIEADYWAGQAGADLVTAEHVDRAIDEKVYRVNMLEDRVRELIERGTIMIDVQGAVPGQVNGLAVLDIGDLSSGGRRGPHTPAGQRGVVSIDRESHLSGRSTKGVLTLTGFLGWKYGQERPLSLSATVSFEQGYEMVDGDSASLAETCAILSAVGDLPIKQGIAMTGSMNQKGEVQPIGGVNQKVEGFHDVCKATGFTGEQGRDRAFAELKNLMLRADVVESVREEVPAVGVSTIEDALEILTGIPAGERGDDGKYPEGSVHHTVEKKLQEMGETLKKAAAAAGRRKDAKEAGAGEEQPAEEEKKPRRRGPKPPGPRDEKGSGYPPM